MSRTHRKKILYVPYPLSTVSEESCGGAEQILRLVEQEVHRRGHITSVAACIGSKISGEHIDTGTVAHSLDQLQERDLEHNARILQVIGDRAGASAAFDLVHDHGGRFWPFAGNFDTPLLLTLHLPRVFYPVGIFEHIPKNVFFNCVSQSQLPSFSDLPRMMGVVRNGIDVTRFTCVEKKQDYLVWLGRVCEEKGPHLAAEVAERTGRPLILMGPSYLYPAHQEYFDERIAPFLKRNPKISYVGSPSLSEKARLLSHAHAILVPSLVAETSSLVSLEAMACGTPVIALRQGALPEVVRDGITGLIVDTVEEMAHAVGRVSSIRSHLCREHVENNYTHTRMADDYEGLYDAILKGRRAAARLPRIPAMQSV